MYAFTENQLLGAFLAIAGLLLVTRAMAELSRRLQQPEVLGELLGGFVLGPSVLGALLPHAYKLLFLNPTVSLSLQLISWIGAILLLMIAGMEADLAILRDKAAPGLLSAAGAIGAALGAGTWCGMRFFGLSPAPAFFLGLVLSVTAVSVVAKLLIEREALRRDYAQVLLAAGIAGEVLVWPLISVVSSVQHRTNAWAAGGRATLLAAGFFALMLTLGRRFTFWAMRRVADVTAIPNGELSLVLVLLCVSAAATTVMGLHPLLGAFVFGVLLGKAPRANAALKERIQALTVALFAPVFFGLAGMRVDLFKLRGTQSLRDIAVLLLLAGAAKIAFGLGGALAGKLPLWDAALVGLGLNLKGGTDVVVAIIGTELGLMSGDLYSTYAVVAILTVVLTPPAMNWLAGRTAPGEDEQKRLNREEARKLAYLADRERVLLPMLPELLPSNSALIVSAIAAAKQGEAELFDITELSVTRDTTLTRSGTADSVVLASGVLAAAAEQEHVGLQHMNVHKSVETKEQLFQALHQAAANHEILAIGSTGVRGQVTASFGPLQDRLLRETTTDVLMTVAPENGLAHVAGSGNAGDRADHGSARTPRILVPINGLAHSLAAADVAGYVAKGLNGEVVLLTVVAPELGSLFWRERRHRDLLRAGYSTTHEALNRIARLGIRVSEEVLLHQNPAEALAEELERNDYDLLVAGSVMRTSPEGIALGRTVERILQTATVPRVLLISRETAAPTA